MDHIRQVMSDAQIKRVSQMSRQDAQQLMCATEWDVMHKLPFGIAVFNAEGKILHWNAAFAQEFGTDNLSSDQAHEALLLALMDRLKFPIQVNLSLQPGKLLAPVMCRVELNKLSDDLYVISLLQTGEVECGDCFSLDSHALLSIISDGIALYDRHDHLIALNDGYRDCFHLSEKICQPGTPYERMRAVQASEIIQDQLAVPVKDITGKVVDEMRTVSGRFLQRTRTRLPDGRLIESLRDISGREEAEKYARQVTRIDALTGLANRGQFIEWLDQAIEQENQKGILIFLDIDQFRDINESLGYEIGDFLLCSVAAKITRVIPSDQCLARIGPDEFAILMLDDIDDLTISLLCEQINQELDRSLEVEEGVTLEVSASFGAVSFDTFRESSCGSITQCAEMALHRARTEGNGQLIFFSDEMGRQVNRVGIIRGGLRDAIEHKQFFPVYQPKIDVATGSVMGMESLTRWKHPTYGLISPIEFIPVAEATGLIAQIGEEMLTQSCIDTRKWRDSGFKDLRLAVNISTAQFRRQSIVGSVMGALELSGLPPEALEIEITESILVHEENIVIDTLRWLRDLGISIAIDDFGTGYSAMSYLKKFSVDTLKIDGAFVHKMHESEKDLSIVRAVIQLAHGLGAKVVAEGVDSPEHVPLLKDLKCDIGQGYLMSEPLISTDFTEYLNSTPYNHAFFENIPA